VSVWKVVIMSKRKAEDDAAPAGQDSAAADTETAPGQRSGKKGKYRRDKPWDVDGIDHWKVRWFG
jgi:ribosomal RNA assembly protein